mmetsp:Transcript_20795/g.63269  ORF Transcript_20795/g.63269 Transcript_20795/m.63269 type:complete len:274 (+) Transcript_20795:1503-2324(+)
MRSRSDPLRLCWSEWDAMSTVCTIWSTTLRSTAERGSFGRSPARLHMQNSSVDVPVPCTVRTETGTRYTSASSLLQLSSSPLCARMGHTRLRASQTGSSIVSWSMALPPAAPTATSLYVLMFSIALHSTLFSSAHRSRVWRSPRCSHQYVFRPPGTSSSAWSVPSTLSVTSASSFRSTLPGLRSTAAKVSIGRRLRAASCSSFTSASCSSMTWRFQMWNASPSWRLRSSIQSLAVAVALCKEKTFEVVSRCAVLDASQSHVVASYTAIAAPLR